MWPRLKQLTHLYAANRGALDDKHSWVVGRGEEEAGGRPKDQERRRERNQANGVFGQPIGPDAEPRVMQRGRPFHRWVNPQHRRIHRREILRSAATEKIVLPLKR